MYLNQEIYGTEAEIQLPLLKEVSRFQRLFLNLQLVNARQDGLQKFAPIPMDRQLPDGDWSTSGHINSC